MAIRRLALALPRFVRQSWGMTQDANTAPARPTAVRRTIGRVLLGLFLIAAGVGHLTIARQAFQAQVPLWLPFDVDFVVVASGIVEILSLIHI